MKKKKWKLKTLKDVFEEPTEEEMETRREIENTYRRGYWDGVYQATEYIGKGSDNRQVRHWLWNALSKWRRVDLSQHPEPPTMEVWKKIRKRILKRDKNICDYCGEYANHVDHVVPVSRGGSYEDSNLVAACKACNMSKGSKLISEWL